MILDFFKRGRVKRPRFSFSTRRVTGAVASLPKPARLALQAVGLLALLSVFAGLSGGLFWYYFRRTNDLFVLRDVRSSISITTGKTLTPDLVCEVLGLREGVNLFSIPIERKRRELSEQAPNIKSMSIVRTLPDKMKITIIEREPIARVGVNGRVVDEEGVVFVRYAGIGGLPLITGSDVLAQIKPGDRLRHIEQAAVRLIHSLQRPSCGLRVLVVNVSRDDHLLLTFSDHRQAKFAWKGMNDEAADTRGPMEAQLDMLDKLMDGDVGRHCLVWDARIPGRITATLPSDK